MWLVVELKQTKFQVFQRNFGKLYRSTSTVRGVSESLEKPVKDEGRKEGEGSSCARAGRGCDVTIPVQD